MSEYCQSAILSHQDFWVDFAYTHQGIQIALMSNILRNIAAITVDQYQYRESSFGLIKEGGAVYEILEHGGASTFSALNHARRQAGTTRASVVRQDTCLHVLFNVQWAQKGLPCFLNESNWKPRRPHSNHFSQKLKTIKACSCQLEWMVIFFLIQLI